MGAQWVKARSVPSTGSPLGAALVIMLAIGPAISSTVPAATLAGDDGPFEPLGAVLSGIFMTQVALGVLGVMLMSTEYSTGSVRNALGAVPQRGMLLTAKALMLVALTRAAGPARHRGRGDDRRGDPARQGPRPRTHRPGRRPRGCRQYDVLVLTALLGLAVGTALRSTAAAVIVLTLVLFLLPVLVQLLPAGIGQPVGRWLPSQAGTAVLQTAKSPAHLSPVAGLAVAAGYTALALVAAAVALRRRDA